MKNENQKKDINVEDASKWLQIIITFGTFIKSLFTKKKPKNLNTN